MGEIPEAAVEAAAKGLARHKWPTAIGVWESFGQGMQDDFRDQARAALEAVAAIEAPVIPWGDLKPYEQQQGGYWLYGPHAGLYGEGKEFIRVTRLTK